jgi:hypothetical protein
MKKIIISLTIFLCSFPVFSQTGTGWVPYRSKMNLRDSVYFNKDANFVMAPRFQSSFKIGAVTVTANGTELNILDNALVSTTELNYLVGVTSNVQTQINSKVSASALSSYAPIANPNFTGSARLASDSLMTKTRVKKIINDSLNARVADAIDIEDYLAGYIGSAGGVDTLTRLQFIIGETTGAPSAGDSTITHSAFKGLDVNVYRNGKRQYYSSINNGGNKNYRFNSSTGKVTVHPAFVTGDTLIIEAFEPITLKMLSIEGQESTILDSILCYYSLNEVSGNIVSDATGHQNGTTTATPNAPGISGKAEQFDGTDCITIPHNAALVPHGDEMSISLWVYFTSLPSAVGHNGVLARLRDADTPYYSAFLYVGIENSVTFALTNTSGTEFAWETLPGAITAGTWHHVCAVAEGNGEDAKIYVDGLDATSYHPETFSGTLLQYDSTVSFGNHSDGSNYNIVGYIDEILISNMAFSAGDVSDLYNAGLSLPYPF